MNVRWYQSISERWVMSEKDELQDTKRCSHHLKTPIDLRSSARPAGTRKADFTYSANNVLRAAPTNGKRTDRKNVYGVPAPPSSLTRASQAQAADDIEGTLSALRLH